jgi:hypothetical protein
MSLIRANFLSLCCLATVIMPVAAATIEQTTFEDRVRIDQTLFKLNNVGVMRYRLVFKPFVAALYLGEDAHPKQVLNDVPKRLEIEYYYSLVGRDIATAGEKILAANISAEQLQALRPRINQMQGWYEDVKPGDRYTLTYIPGRGTELALNGKSKGIIEGADFAAAYFTIWLGTAPMDDWLKNQLLRR